MALQVIHSHIAAYIVRNSFMQLAAIHEKNSMTNDQ